LFEALVLAMAEQMTFAAVARLVNESWHRVHAIGWRYVNLAVAEEGCASMACIRNRPETAGPRRH
jgi:transposase